MEEETEVSNSRCKGGDKLISFVFGFGFLFVLLFGEPFFQDQFLEYLHLEAVRRDLRALIENKSRIMGAHASSGYK